MKTKTLQIHTPERLKQDASLSYDEIAQFLEDFRWIAQGDEGVRKLISIRVPEKMLVVFREKAKRNGKPYQTQIIELMRQWVMG